MSETLREEFNQWALDGRGAQLESHHLAFLQQMIERMQIQPRDRILDIGCGEGWSCRLLAKLVPEGMVAGIDVADEMVHNARLQSVPFENLIFVWGEAENIPWRDQFFSKVLCVESFYYMEDPEKALKEIVRVLTPGGSVWILNHLSKENELSLRWIRELKVPVQLRSAQEYRSLFEQCGLEDFQSEMLPDLSPVPEGYQSATFPDPSDFAHFRQAGALLMQARKPPEPPPSPAD